MERRFKEMLDRQAAWQRSRAAIPWSEKLRLSKIMRETQQALRAGFRDSEYHELGSLESRPDK
jgi:hypothetical protein